MAKIDRNSASDAQRVLEKLMPNRHAREANLNFLANAILYANRLNPDNWNLNLDQSGRFIQFNTGYVFSAAASKRGFCILALKKSLKNTCSPNELGIRFRGRLPEERVNKNRIKKKRVTSFDIDRVPDMLIKVPDSVVCESDYLKMSEILEKLESSNRNFIDIGIRKSTIMPRMFASHSPGFIAYLSDVVGKRIPNPTYYNSENNLYQRQLDEERDARRLSFEELRLKIKDSNRGKPETVEVTAVKFRRNPYVSAYAKTKANGICQDCGQQAPFINKQTNEPFLETHHIIPLADGGDDTIENTIALCPNCHRKRHYG